LSRLVVIWSPNEPNKLQKIKKDDVVSNGMPDYIKMLYEMVHAASWKTYKDLPKDDLVFNFQHG
jgi:hypothetical protein